MAKLIKYFLLVKLNSKIEFDSAKGVNLQTLNILQKDLELFNLTQFLDKIEEYDENLYIRCEEFLFLEETREKESAENILMELLDLINENGLVSEAFFNQEKNSYYPEFLDNICFLSLIRDGVLEDDKWMKGRKSERKKIFQKKKALKKYKDMEKRRKIAIKNNKKWQ